MTGWLFRFRVRTNANFRDDNPRFVFSRDGRLVRAGMGSSPVTSVAPPATTLAAK